MGEDLIIKRPYATIKEVKSLEEDNENCIRVYCTQRGCGVHPDRFAFQIRTHKPIVDRLANDKGKPRNMVAHVELNVEEFKKILAEMEKTG